MRSEKPSRTAQFVAYNRALGNLAPQVPGFSDPLAAEFMPEKWRAKIRRTQAKLSAHPAKSPYPFWLRGMGLFNQFRTVVLDRAIAAAGPIAQLVILGAGFDTRAWRLDAVAETTVFEVDHPATQAVKTERAAAVPPKARQVRFVATDFHRQDMAKSLLAAGYDAQQPAFWLWEGVTMYLRPEAVAANLDTLATLSAPGQPPGDDIPEQRSWADSAELISGVIGRASARSLCAGGDHRDREVLWLGMHRRFRNRGLAARIDTWATAHPAASGPAMV